MNRWAEIAPATDAPAAPDVEIVRPAVQTAPFVFASPHSGRRYSPAFLASSRLDPLMLRRSEDCYVDELFDAAPTHGAPLLLAHFPRAYCDANRDPAELDPAIFAESPPSSPQTRSPRVSAGLGVIARVVREGADIYPERIPLAEAARRLAGLHAPYHAALKDLVADTRARFGSCVLIDCHSMPSQATAATPGPRGAPDVILGDRYGASCSAALTSFTERALTGLGFTVGRNNPYAGGYTVERYGAPRERIHALQIEVSRSLYLDEDRLEKRPSSFEKLRGRLGEFVRALVAFPPH